MIKWKFGFHRGFWWYVVLMCVMVAVLIGSHLGWFPKFLVFNKSGSLPVGYYMKVPMGEIKEGDLVEVELPESMRSYAIDRGWMMPGELLLKKVGGLDGSSYLVDDRNFVVNGKYIGPIYDKDSKGLPMPVLRGEFVVKKGYFLPVADRIPNSFDGRYFGEVPMESIKGKVVPLLTF